MQHHDEAIERFLARTAPRQEVVGVLLTGSLATGTERTDSDVDLVVVVTEHAFETAEAAQRIMVVDDHDAGYAGGYFDVKLATVRQLEAASERADDPARHSLGTARMLFDQGFGLEERIRGIAAGHPADDREAVASFVAQARLHGDYFLVHGLEHDDPFLAAHAATHLALAAGRGLLAHLGALYPGPKDLVATLSAPRPRAAVRGRGRDGDPVTLPRVRAGAARPRRAAPRPLAPRGRHAVRLRQDNELAWFTGIARPEHR